MTDHLIANGHVVESLGSAARRGGSGLETTPALLRRVLEDEAWRQFTTQRGEVVQPRSFREFVTTPPLKGLGVDMDLIERIVGTDDPDLLRLLREAQAGQGGRPRRDETPLESNGVSQGESSSYTAARLARDHPEQYAAVKAGDLTLHAAAVLAGIRPRRFSVSAADPVSVARSLRRNMEPEVVAKLVEELQRAE